MGVGGSRERYEPRPRRRSPAPRRGKKRRRGFLRKVRPTPTTQPIIPIRYHSPHRYSYGSRSFVPPMPVYAPLPPVFSASMPIPYNNYAAFPYVPPRQPLMMPPPQVQPMLMPQQVLQAQPVMMPQQVPQYQPVMVPQQIPQPQPQPVVMPPQVPPYIPSPYSMNVPLSTPYVQQQPQVQPIYSNVGVSAPMSAGMTGPTGPYYSSYRATNLFTDWTGGGKISPGFLGPPI